MRFHFSVMIVGILSLLPMACVPQETSSIDVERDVVFGTGGIHELKLDLARPHGEGLFPAILCLHGGGWVGGDRQQMEETIKVLAARGYVAVTPDYRLAPRDSFPAAIEDCKAAVRWLRANAVRLKVDSGRIGVLGFAAGGHLACLLGVTDKADGFEGKGGNPNESSRVQAVVSFFGPTDLSYPKWDISVRENNLVPFLGGTLEKHAEAYRKASPLTYVRKGTPPFLFIHGAEDKIVPPSQSQDMADKLTSVGCKARVLLLEGEGHGLHGEKLHRGLVEMVAFFDENVKRQER